MKKLNYFLVSILVSITINSNAQDDGVLNRLNGTPVKQAIFIKWNPRDKVFEFNVDDKHETFFKLSNDYIFNVKNKYGNTCRIYTSFYNPLKYNLKSSIKEIDDPNYKTISDFISQLPGISSVVSDKPKTTEEIKNEKLSLTNGGGNNDLLKSVLLSEWFFNVSIFDTAIIKSPSFNTNFNKVKLIETFLYDNVNIKNFNKSYTFYNWIKLCNDSLYEASNDYLEFLRIKKNVMLIRDSLELNRKNVIKISQQVIDNLTIYFDGVFNPIINQNKKGVKKTVQEIAYFKNYTFYAGQNLKSFLDEQLKQREGAINNLNELISKLETFCSDYEGEDLSPSQGIGYVGWKREYEFNIVWASKMMKNIDYDIKMCDSKGNELPQNGGSANFIVAKRWTLLPFISTGLIYTNVTYPNYSLKTDNLTNTVATSEKTVINYRPAVFLNLLLANWEPFYPFAQVGITTGENDALFPVGIGIALGKNFTLSGGVMLGYRKDLTNLKVGSVVVDELELKNDLKYKALTSYYFSINYSFHK
jgi:hypothetical protein